jgi:hypothetical protein
MDVPTFLTARLEAADSKELASGPEFLPITIGWRASGGGANGSRDGGAAPGGTKPKTEEAPERPTLGLQ